MGTYQDGVLSAWKQVNAAAASLKVAGAAPAFRQAIAATDFASLVPSFDFGPLKVYALDWLEGRMIYVDTAAQMAVVSHELWTILSCDYDVLDQFIEDLVRGASGVKIIDYDTGPYRHAGKAWRALKEDKTAPADPLTQLEEQLTTLLSRTEAVMKDKERSSEQFQVLFSEIAAAQERYEELQAKVAKLGALLETARDAVAEI